MPFVDLRGHYFNRKNRWAYNIGLGARYIPHPYCSCEVVGANLYFDQRKGCLGNYSLLGAGVEYLGRCWEARANATFPLGKAHRKKICRFDNYSDNYFYIQKDQEWVFHNYNFELGFYLWRSHCFSFYIGGGPYYWGSDCFQSAGGRIRIRPQFKDYFSLDLSLQYDSLFDTVFQAKFVFSWPLYQQRCLNKAPCCLSDRQIYRPPERFEIMPVAFRRCFEANFD